MAVMPGHGSASSRALVLGPASGFDILLVRPSVVVGDGGVSGSMVWCDRRAGLILSSWW